MALRWPPRIARLRQPDEPRPREFGTVAAQELEDDLADMVSYDRWQLDAAAELGIATASPGT